MKVGIVYKWLVALRKRWFIKLAHALAGTSNTAGCFVHHSASSW